MTLKKIKANKLSTAERLDDENEMSATLQASRAFPNRAIGDNSNLNPEIAQFLSTLQHDYQLYPYVIESLKAQFKMHVRRNIIPEYEGKQLIEALDKVQKELAKGQLVCQDARSIYSVIENRVSEITPEGYLWFSAARSNAAQSVGDFKIWTRNAIDTLDLAIQKLQAQLIDRAEDTVKTIFPHNVSSQLTQPTSLGHHFMAYVEAFNRDRSRLQDARARMNESPFATFEGVGTSLNINREMVSRLLSFDRVAQNSLDAVCSRDFVVEFLAALSTHFVHLSRLAGEMIKWHHTNSNYINFNLAFAEQDPVLPERKDQLTLEALRAKASKSIGALTSSLSLLKDLSFESSHDYTELLEITMQSFAEAHSATRIMTVIMSNFTLNRKVMKEAASRNYSTAYDLVEWIMQKTGANVSEAQRRARQIIDYAIEKGKKLSLLELDEIKSIEPAADEEIYSVLIPSRALIRRRSGNGSNPVQIRKAIRNAKRKYL